MVDLQEPKPHHTVRLRVSYEVDVAIYDDETEDEYIENVLSSRYEVPLSMATVDYQTLKLEKV